MGDSLSDSSEKLLQSGGRESKVSIYVILVKGKYMQSSTFLNYYFFFFWQKVSASQETGITMKEFSPFLNMRRYKS